MTKAEEATYWVDIPTPDCVNNPDGAWKEMAQFSTKAEAIAYAKKHFGADDEGRIYLVV